MFVGLKYNTGSSRTGLVIAQFTYFMVIESDGQSNSLNVLSRLHWKTLPCKEKHFLVC